MHSVEEVLNALSARLEPAGLSEALGRIAGRAHARTSGFACDGGRTRCALGPTTLGGLGGAGPPDLGGVRQFHRRYPGPASAGAARIGIHASVRRGTHATDGDTIARPLARCAGGSLAWPSATRSDPGRAAGQR